MGPIEVPKETFMALNGTRDQAFPGPREDPLERTFLGGSSMGARVGWLILAGMIAFGLAGAALYHVDERANRLFTTIAASNEIQGRITRIEQATAAIRTEARAFLTSRDPRAAESYRRASEGLSTSLKSLVDDPVAIDAQRFGATLNDGITQHSEQFQNIVRINTLLGGPNTGLIGNTQSGGAALERRTAEASPPFAQRVASLRRVETALINGTAAPADKTLSDEIGELRRAIAESTLSQNAKQDIDRLAEAYASDLGQLARTRTTVTQATTRLDEIEAYIAPSLDALTGFASEFSQNARRGADATRQQLRLIAAGGVGAGLLVLLLTGLSMLRSLTRPVLRLAASAAELAHGNHMIAIPVLGNDDATGTIARALTYFRENLIQADRLRKELELALQRADAAQPVTPLGITSAILPPPTVMAPEPVLPPEPVIPEPILPEPELPRGRSLVANKPERETGTQISVISRMLAVTSQAASAAAGEAERTESMVNGLSETIQKIDDVETLLASISDQMSLLAVQTALSDDAGDTRENLVVLAEKRQNSNIGQSVADRIDTIQAGTKRAIKSVQQIGRTISEVNEVAVQFASDASSEALDAATELLRQSEDLRGMLDDLLNKIRAEGGGTAPLLPRGRQTERE
jgi:methyl-accepting chemotaxis protein